MYRTILIPTDGSAMSARAVASGLAFASEIGAAVLTCHVVALPFDDELEAWTHHDPGYAERRRALFEKFADEYLAFVAGRAAAASVACTCRKLYGAEPHRELLAAASSAGCDLIYIASHGWRAGVEQVAGSVTLKLLQHSQIPVLVHKCRAQAG